MLFDPRNPFDNFLSSFFLSPVVHQIHCTAATKAPNALLALVDKGTD